MPDAVAAPVRLTMVGACYRCSCYVLLAVAALLAVTALLLVAFAELRLCDNPCSCLPAFGPGFPREEAACDAWWAANRGGGDL